MFAPARPADRPLEIVCLVYHRFGDARYPSTNVALDVFEAHLRVLQDGGYVVLPLGEALDRLAAAGTEDLPYDKIVVLTVDDGYTTFATGAMPLLKAYGYPATLFVNTAQVGAPGYLSWPQLESLAADGVEIGNHSHSHAYFVDLPEAERVAAFREDVERAESVFDSRLGPRPRLFSYPFGEFTPEMRDTIEALGFRAAVAQNSGVIHSGSDRFALPRFPMGGPYATVQGFRTKIGTRALPVLSTAPESSVWTEPDPPILTLRVDPTGLNASAMQCFIDGSRACRLLPVPDAAGTFRMIPDGPLTGRRSLYTITAPSDGGPETWHWFSRMWVRPGVPE